MPDENNPPSRDIPSAIKREVRQRCGFGCVVCGAPFYQYDHLDGWAHTQEHNPERIILLCAKHHDEKTRYLLPASVLDGYAKNPLNRRQGESTAQVLHFSGRSCAVHIGSNSFVADPLPDDGTIVPIAVDGMALVSARRESGELLLSMNAFDTCNNHVVMISDNELQFSASPWDITWEGRRIVVRLAPRWILLDLELQPPTGLAIHRGRFLSNGVWIEVTNNQILVANTGAKMSGNMVNGRWAGLVIGDLPEAVHDVAWYLAHVPRYPSTMFQALGISDIHQQAEEPPSRPKPR